MKILDDVLKEQTTAVFIDEDETESDDGKGGIMKGTDAKMSFANNFVVPPPDNAPGISDAIVSFRIDVDEQAVIKPIEDSDGAGNKVEIEQ